MRLSVGLSRGDGEGAAGWCREQSRLGSRDRKGSLGIVSPRLWEGLRGLRLKERGEDTLGVLSPSGVG